MLFLALIFVSLLVLNLLTGAGAYIKHERDLYALSAVYQIYCTVVTFEVWLQWEINITYTHIIIHIHTQTDVTKRITLLRICSQGNNLWLQATAMLQFAVH